MDRLTRFVTTPQPMDPTSEKLIDVLKATSLQGNNQTGTTEVKEDQPLMYKEEEKPQFVGANITKKRTRKVNVK